MGEASVNGGNPGFNSGVLLLDLEKLRSSHLFDFLNLVSWGESDNLIWTVRLPVVYLDL